MHTSSAGAEVVEDQAVVGGTGLVYTGEFAGQMARNFTIMSSRDPNDLALSVELSPSMSDGGWLMQIRLWG
jgi:hypothetical protein